MNKIYSSFATSKSIQTFLLIFFFLISFHSNAQMWEWVATAGGDGSDKALDLDIDKYGNSYICGYYNSGTSSSDVSFGAINPPIDFGKEGYVAKIDSLGNWQWVQSAMGGWDERALGLCVDKVNDFVYVTGTCWNYTNFGSCAGASFPGGGDNIFIGKFDLSGTCQWLLGAGGSGDDHGYDLVTDKLGNIYLTGLIGLYTNPATFGAISVPNPGLDSLGFVAKLSPAGVFQWVKTFKATDGERDNRIAVDTTGNVYVTGGFRGTKPFGPITATSFGGRDIFVLKYDSSGNQLWLKTVGGLLDDRGNSVAIDIEQDVYITGEFRDKVVFGSDTVNNNGGPNGRDIFVAKLTKEGSWVWAKKAGSNAGSDRGNRIAANKQDLLFVTGQFRGDASFGAADTLWNPADSVQIYIAAIDTAGKWQWAIQAGGPIEDRGNGIAVDDNCNIFTTGYYELTASFGPINITSSGKKEIYVTKIPGACIYNNVGISETNHFENVRFYPNPSNGNLTIEFGKVYDDLTIQIHDVVGQTIQIKKYQATDRADITIDQANGIYFVHLISKDGDAVVLKLIKEN